MFSVEQIGNHFKVTFGSEETTVDLIEEAHEAMNHYFRSGPRAAQHERNAIDHCALCIRGRDVPKLRLARQD